MANLGDDDLPIRRDGRAPRKRKREGDHPFDIRPIPVKKDPDEKKPIKGADIIPELYPGSVACVAKTKSGKTTVINHILEHTIDERTDVHIFCSTANVDEGWKTIIKNLRARGIAVHVYPATMVGHGTKRINFLKILYDNFEAEDKRADANKKVKKGLHELSKHNTFLAVHNPVADPENVGIREEKVYHDRVPKRQVILDDLSIPELHDESVDTALKKTRHYKCRVICSTQHIMHMSKTAFGQLTMVLLWRGFSQDYIKSLIDGRLITSLEFKKFYLLYKSLTKPDYSFISVYQTEGEIRHKFSKPPIPIEAIFEDDPDEV